VAKRRVGILTGGGDAPGLNGIIEASSRALIQAGFEVIGIMDGYEGIFNNRYRDLTADVVHGVHIDAGTLLGTSNKTWIAGRADEFNANYKKLNVEGLIVAGGDGTFAGLSELGDKIVPAIGVPKTIDNDLAGTEVTFGYDTACSVIAEAADALRTTANAHRRIMIIEAMGRTAGWLALGGGLAGYADVILIPERPFSKEALLKFIKEKQKTSRGLVMVVAEGAFAKGESPHVAFKVKGSPQEERYGGVAEMLARWIEAETGWESRHVVLGHLQRSKAPTTTDRFLTLTMGVEVAKMVQDKAWGQAVVYRDGRVQRAPLTELMQPARLVDKDHRWVQLAQALGIFI
jgi:ATP-dependent phosphofructokinase / diphosphate-dependent phosphofructokinase